MRQSPNIQSHMLMSADDEIELRENFNLTTHARCEFSKHDS
jgi:hypothetical protein